MRGKKNDADEDAGGRHRDEEDEDEDETGDFRAKFASSTKTRR